MRQDDGVVESAICGALRAMRCSMHTYARPRQQGSQTIHIWNFHSTPSSGCTPRPSAILLSPRMLRLNIQLVCAQRKRSLRFSAYPTVCFGCLVSETNPVLRSSFTLMLTVKDSKKSTISIIRGINADSPFSIHGFLLSLKVAA